MKTLSIAKYFVYVLVFAFGGVCTYFYLHIPSRDLKTYQNTSIVRKASDNKFISPLLLTGDSNNSYVQDEFSKNVDEYINTQKREGNATEISYYLKNLSNGTWTGINADQHYAPASLMKVPIMMAILKESETDQNFLNKKILFKDEHDYNNDEYFQPKDKILPGHTYTIEELLRYMINYSDNNATVLLIPQMPIKRMTDIFKDLSLPMPQEGSDGTVDYISAKLYSRLFRVLYNCTYLNEENSAKALELLSGADFPNGLVSAIPGNITVSNKFGERTAYDANGNLLFRELHDCGIVYVADNPYALCVMTKGKDFEKLQRIIQDLSKMTYSKMK